MFSRLFRTLSDNTWRLFMLCLLGSLGCWLISLANVLFAGKLSFAEALGTLSLFTACALLTLAPLTLLAVLSERLEPYMRRMRLPVSLFVTLTALFPLYYLLLTRRSWSYEFLGVSLLISALLFPLPLLLWKRLPRKALWPLTALFSAWIFYSVVDNEGLIVRAGVDLLDLPTVVLLIIPFAAAATALLLLRLADSLRGNSPSVIEAALLLTAGIILTIFSDDAVGIHYENIYRVMALFGFLAMTHGLSVALRRVPLFVSTPLLVLILSAGGLLLWPFDSKPKSLKLEYSELAQNNRSISEILKMTGLAEGERRAAVCRLHHVADYPNGEFAERFEKSLALAAHRPDSDELNIDMHRSLLRPDKPWNFILITVDALRYDKTSYSGFVTPKKTPGLARLARDAQRFHRAYPQGAWTTLSLPAMMLSEFPRNIEYTPVYEDDALKLYLEHELSDKVQIKREFQLPADKGPSLPSMLAKNGFDSIAVANDGSTGFFDPRLGMSKGFSKVKYPGKEGTDTKALELAEEALRASTERSFFLWVHFFDVHSCYKRPKNKKEKEKYRSYDYRVGRVDEKVTRLLDLLEELQLDDNTVVILTGDHGQSLGEQGQKGHGLALNEASLHIPLLIRIPGLPSRDYKRLVSLVDLAPTILDLARLSDAVPTEWVGTSLAPMLAVGRDIDHPPVYVETWRNKIKKAKKYLYLSGIMYEDRKVTIQIDDLDLSLYDSIPRKAAVEKRVYPDLDSESLREDQLYMVKHLLERNNLLIDSKCE